MILTVAIQKGGTAKTTTAAALLQAAAFRGIRALAVDADPQGNLSYALAADQSPGRGNSFHLLEGLPAADLIQTSPQGIDIIPAGWDLSTVTSGRGSARRLQRALEPIKKNYPIIVIDTPPTAGELQYNALQASDGLIIPMQADVYNIQALYQITDTARQIQGSNPDLSFTGVLITQFDGRTTLSRQIRDRIMQEGAALGVPYLGTIRQAVAVKEAAAFRQSLFDYAPKSKPAADYMEIFDKIMQQ